MLKLGSLFDGSGGFPLAGSLCGIEPVWASEIEPYPIAVTRSRFPKMKHFGDISKINGAEVEPVDIITFGSPCQDLSVAGKRAGLKHEANGDEETTRSGLFMEAVRIIKEMREATNGEYPSFALWENVPGAFSSNKGEDFRIVLEELIKIVEPTAVMPTVPKGGWAYADSYCGAGWSIAYRVFDAQYWGVPQRRRRIHLVLDLRGERAQEVLFEREGVRGYFTEGRTPWQAAASYAEGSVGADDREGAVPYTLKIRGGVDVDSAGKSAGKGALIQTNLSATLGTSQDQYLFQPVVAGGFCPEQSAKTRGIGWEEEMSPTLRAGVTPAVVAYSFDSLASNSMKSANPHSGCREVEVSKCLDTTNPDPSKNQGGIAVVQAYSIENHPADSRVNIDESGKVQTLTSRMGTGGGNVPMVMEPVIDVEMEVAVRKYEVDTDRLSALLRDHKGSRTNREIAEALNQPITMVEHWFRSDSYFAIPDADIWFDLKKLLGIETTEFDQCITEYEFKGGNYDMRNRIYAGNVAPTLTVGCGNHLHLVSEPVVFDGANVTSPINASKPQPGDPCHTLSTDNRNLLVEPVYCLQGNGIDRADTAGCNGRGWNDESCYTLNTIDRPAVVYGVETFHCVAEEDKSPTLKARDWKDPHVLCYEAPIAIDRAAFNQGQNAQYDPQFYTDGTVSTLVARGPSAVCYWDGSQTCGTLTANNAGGNQRMPDKENFNCVLQMASGKPVTGCLMASGYEKLGAQEMFSGDYTVVENSCVRYIVRRLTPTECARLQGFADRWGDIEEKDDFTDEEYAFWLDVRNTHAAINGRVGKEYTKAQMLTWYNKLHTDSAEYKMWGNGIALPPALYCMQGIVEASA